MTSSVQAEYPPSIKLVELLVLGSPFIIANGKMDDLCKSSKTDVDGRADNSGISKNIGTNTVNVVQKTSNSGIDIVQKSGQETDEQTRNGKADKRRRSKQEIEEQTRDKKADK